MNMAYREDWEPATKAKLKARMEREGKLHEFNVLKRRLEQDCGFPNKQAWYAAEALCYVDHTVVPAGRVRELPDASAIKDRECSDHEAIKWVADMLGMDEGNAPKVEDAPGKSAWSMYVWATENERHRTEFWKTLFPKRLPVRSSNGKSRDEAKDDAPVRTLDRLLAASED